MKNHSRGFALVTALAIVIISALLSVGIIQALNSYTAMKQMSVEGIRAQYLAEAAMQFAIWQNSTGSFPYTSPAGFTLEGVPVTITTNNATNPATIIIRVD